MASVILWKAAQRAGMSGLVRNYRHRVISSARYHVSHLRARCPEVEKYLGLGPGWRFIFDETYEDVWFDELLLSVS